MPNMKGWTMDRIREHENNQLAAQGKPLRYDASGTKVCAKCGRDWSVNHGCIYDGEILALLRECRSGLVAYSWVATADTVSRVDRAISILER